MRGHHVKNKRDANEGEIFDVLRGFGIVVEPMDRPCDAVCGFGGVNYLVEVKNGTKAKLTPSQQKFKDSWKGQFKTLHTVEEAMTWASAVVRSGGIEFRGAINEIEGTIS